jgi:hypothetical protein
MLDWINNGQSACRKQCPGTVPGYRDWTPPRVRRLLKAVREGASLSLPAQAAISRDQLNLAHLRVQLTGPGGDQPDRDATSPNEELT